MFSFELTYSQVNIYATLKDIGGYTIAELRLLSHSKVVSQKTFYCSEVGKEGWFKYDNLDITSIDNSINTLVTVNNDKLKLISVNKLNTQHILLTKTKSIISDVVNNVSTKRLFWLIFGDSMAGTKTQFILPHINSLIGNSGAIGTGNYLGVTLTSGNYTTFQDYTLFPFTMYKLTASNNLIYGLSGVAAKGNVWKIYYINNGASFKVQIDGVDMFL
jgi:hypothetical protein